MQMHQQHSAQLEMLRSAKLAEAINQKVRRAVRNDGTAGGSSRTTRGGQIG